MPKSIQLDISVHHMSRVREFFDKHDMKDVILGTYNDPIYIRGVYLGHTTKICYLVSSNSDTASNLLPMIMTCGSVEAAIAEEYPMVHT